jgi:hypothetical protein
MSDVLKRAPRGIGERAAVAVIVVLLTALTGGCGSKRAVYIPDDWRTTPPPTSALDGSGRATASRTAPPQPIMQPTPQIEERDLSAAPNKFPGDRIAPEESEADEVPTPRMGATPETPQYLASMHLVNTAKSALQQGNVEQAIAQLEQAIQVDAYNAEAFFVLAQAWQAGGDTKRALEFARKAEILSQDEPQALRRVYLLEAELLKKSGQQSEAEIYRQKAARLEM